jgi:hypothetical protein
MKSVGKKNQVTLPTAASTTMLSLGTEEGVCFWPVIAVNARDHVKNNKTLYLY